MSGQSANLTLKESKALQERVQCHPENHQGKKGGGTASTPIDKKVAHQG